jgi:hypothetical protein
VGINGIRLITGNYDKLKDKKLIVFGLGASPVRPAIVEEVEIKTCRKNSRNLLIFSAERRI